MLRGDFSFFDLDTFTLPLSISSSLYVARCKIMNSIELEDLLLKHIHSPEWLRIEGYDAICSSQVQNLGDV